jgi:hypothetical protein
MDHVTKNPCRTLDLVMVSGLGGQTIAEFAICVAKLARSRDWLIAAPELSTGILDREDVFSDETPLTAVGVTFMIYSELPPYVLSPELQSQQNEDITAYLRAIEAFARAYGVDFEMYLDGDQWGGIENGELLEEGIEAWLVDIEFEPD